jgi:ABC-type multidrug transport system fused ATPase/permease subunit
LFFLFIPLTYLFPCNYFSAMSYKRTILQIIWQKNKYPIAFVYTLNIIEETFYLLIPSSVGLLIDTFIYDKGFGIWAFAISYIGWQGVAVYRKIQDTKIFTDLFTQFSLEIIENHKHYNIGTAKTTARVELMTEVVDFFETDLPFMVNSIISIVGACILLYFYNVKLLVVSLVIFFPSLLINYFYSKKILAVTKKINDQYENQVDIIESEDKDKQQLYFTELRKLNIEKSTLEAYNFGLLEIFVFIMIITCIYIICKTENLNYGDIIASYGIILRFAYGFDFIPHATTKLATIKDIASRVSETFEKKYAQK